MCAALNPMAASFGLSGGAVAAVAAAAAAAVFGTGNPVAGANQAAINAGASSGTGGASTSSVQSIAGNLLLNLNLASFSHLQQTTATQASAAANIVPNYHQEKVEWMNRIENSQIDRALMNRLVMNYLVTEGFKEAADKFQSETGIYYPYDCESLNQRIRIREAIELGNVTQAIFHINNLHPELIDSNRMVAFHLQQQQLIELIREKRLEDALTFAQDHLCEYGENDDQIQEELERTMALLAFENPSDSPFSDLLQAVQRQRLASEVNSAILEFENVESNAKLNILIKMLLWSQDLLDKRSIAYPKMSDIGNARVEEAVSVAVASVANT